MNRRTPVRALLVALITALVVVPGTAFGAKPIEQFHDHFTDSFSDEICGIPVDIDLVVTDNFFVHTRRVIVQRLGRSPPSRMSGMRRPREWVGGGVP